MLVSGGASCVIHLTRSSIDPQKAAYLSQSFQPPAGTLDFSCPSCNSSFVGPSTTLREDINKLLEPTPGGGRAATAAPFVTSQGGQLAELQRLSTHFPSEAKQAGEAPRGRDGTGRLCRALTLCLFPPSQSVSVEGNMVVSTLSLQATADILSKGVSCEASNEHGSDKKSFPVSLKRGECRGGRFFSSFRTSAARFDHAGGKTQRFSSVVVRRNSDESALRKTFRGKKNPNKIC